jgi:energy-coupling factor transport system substrate-specific component
VDLVRRLLSRRRGNGSFDGLVNITAFGVLALRASGRSARDRSVRRAAAWIASRQNRDGGWNFSGGGTSGIDDTSAAVQALVAAGRTRSRGVSRGVRFIRARQNGDGGFPLQPRSASNAQSTAWAVQALVAARVNPSRVRRGGSRTPLAYLRTLIGPDGSVRYSRTSRQTPVWVTAQALTALARRPFPVRAPRR